MNELDRNLFLSLNKDMGEIADIIFLFLTSYATLAVFGAIAFFLIFRKYGFLAALVSIFIVVAGVVSCEVLANYLNTYFGKLRPIHTAGIQLQAHFVTSSIKSGLYGTVSAFTASSFFIAIFSAMIINKKLYTVLAVILALAISYSQIYLALHFPLDVIYGIALGGAIAVIYYMLLMLFTHTKNRR